MNLEFSLQYRLAAKGLQKSHLSFVQLEVKKALIDSKNRSLLAINMLCFSASLHFVDNRPDSGRLFH